MQHSSFLFVFFFFFLFFRARFFLAALLRLRGAHPHPLLLLGKLLLRSRTRLRKPPVRPPHILAPVVLRGEPRHHKQRVGQPVHVLGHGQPRLVLEVPHHAPLAPPADGACEVEVGGRHASCGEDKGTHGRQLLVDGVDELLEHLHLVLRELRVRDAVLRRGAPWCGHVRPHVHQLRLHHVQVFLEPVLRSDAVLHRDAHGGVQLVHRADHLEDHLVFPHTLPREQPALSLVTRACVDAAALRGARLLLQLRLRTRLLHLLRLPHVVVPVRTVPAPAAAAEAATVVRNGGEDLVPSLGVLVRLLAVHHGVEVQLLDVGRQRRRAGLVRDRAAVALWRRRRGGRGGGGGGVVAACGGGGRGDVVCGPGLAKGAPLPQLAGTEGDETPDAAPRGGRRRHGVHLLRAPRSSEAGSFDTHAAEESRGVCVGCGCGSGCGCQ
eukprot:Rhum_TRINITY_DN8982_c0_g2::Rhum_TRINITY_DN8982_c0_g2_i1::g.30949::m.30949